MATLYDYFTDEARTSVSQVPTASRGVLSLPGMSQISQEDAVAVAEELGFLVTIEPDGYLQIKENLGDVD